MKKYNERKQTMLDDILLVFRIITSIVHIIVKVIDILDRRKNRHQKSSCTDQS